MDNFNKGNYKNTGCNVTLTADINLADPETQEATEIKPIGDWDNSFTGTFDGGNYTISNAIIKGSDESGVIRAGLIGCVNGGTVQNLVLDNVTVSNSSTSNGTTSSSDSVETASGIAVATLNGGTVKKVTTNANCSVDGHYRVGGIVGDSRANAEIRDCTNNATITGKNLYTGGIVGAAHTTSRVASARGTHIINCINGNAEDAECGIVNGVTNVGGIVGYADRADIENCKNYAQVTGRGNYGTGGILGCDVYNPVTLGSLVIMNPTTGSKISYCENAGDIFGGRAGGIVGSYIVVPGKKQPTGNSYAVCTIDHCSNTGNIEGTTGKCGAIFGFPISYANGDGSTYVDHMKVSIIDCTFQCSVNESPATEATPSPYQK